MNSNQITKEAERAVGLGIDAASTSYKSMPISRADQRLLRENDPDLYWKLLQNSHHISDEQVAERRKKFERKEAGKEEERKIEVIDTLRFPMELLDKGCGEHNLAGDIVKGFRSEYDSSPQHYYAATLACMGVIFAPYCKFYIGIDSYPTLFVFQLGKSFKSRKSTATNMVVSLFESCFAKNTADPLMDMTKEFPVIANVGSDVGLAKALMTQEQKNLLLFIDELEGLLAKAGISGSSLLAALATSFSTGRLGNWTKEEHYNLKDGRLGIVACCTYDLFNQLFTTRHKQIGFINRIIIISGTSDGTIYDERSELPEPLYEEMQGKIKESYRWITTQLEAVDTTTRNGSPILYFDFESSEVKEVFITWIRRIDSLIDLEGGHIYERIETYAKKLLCLFCINERRLKADLGIVQRVISFLEWQIAVRKQFTPLVAGSRANRMEQKVLRPLLAKRGYRHRKTAAQIRSSEKFGEEYTNEELTRILESGVIAGLLLKEITGRGTVFYWCTDDQEC